MQIDHEARRRLLKSAEMLKAFYEAKLNVPLELLTEAPAPAQSGDVRFAQEVADYGLWGFRPSRPISSDDQRQISDMCDALLGGFEAMHRQLEDLKVIEAQLEHSLAGEAPSNVIAFKARARAREDSFFYSQSKRYDFKLDCLIESSSAVEIHKMAVELHSHGARSAFVHYWDLAPTHRESISQLLSLGAISLFVPSLLALSSLEQEILRHLIQQETLQRPLLMVGTQIPYGELVGNPHVDSQFLSLLARAYIKLSRPFSEYKEQGLIHYFLDSLSTGPT